MAMAESEAPKTISMEKARSGETSGHVRIMLVVSTVMAIVALGIILAVYAH
jgi:hypothetical protein